MDELDGRVRLLEAERLRPVPPLGISAVALAELVDLLGDEDSGIPGAGVAPDPLAGEADLTDDVCLCLTLLKRRLHLSDKVLARFRGAFVCGLVGACELAKTGSEICVHSPMFAHGLRPHGEAIDGSV